MLTSVATISHGVTEISDELKNSEISKHLNRFRHDEFSAELTNITKYLLGIVNFYCFLN